MELRGKRILVRPWQADDAPHLARNADNPNVARGLRDQFPQPYTEADAETWIASCQDLPEKQIALAITVEEVAIGGIGGLFKDDVHHRTFEVGYWLGEEHWRKGIASEALQLLCDHLFTNTNCVRIEAHVFEVNTASSQLLRKNGFQLEGRQHCAVEKNGELMDLLMHARLHPDHAQRTRTDSCDILSL